MSLNAKRTVLAVLVWTAAIIAERADDGSGVQTLAAGACVAVGAIALACLYGPWAEGRRAPAAASTQPQPSPTCTCGSTADAVVVETAAVLDVPAEVVGYLCPDCCNPRPAPYAPPPMAVDQQPDEPLGNDVAALRRMLGVKVAEMDRIAASFRLDPGSGAAVLTTPAEMRVFLRAATDAQNIKDRLDGFRLNVPSCPHDDIQYQVIRNGDGAIIRYVKACRTCSAKIGAC